MKKRLPIGAIIAIVIASCVILYIIIHYSILFILSRADMFAPEITEKNVTTYYGDVLTLQKIESGFPSIHRSFSIKYNNKILFQVYYDTYENICYFPNNKSDNWDEIINSLKAGDVRIYELYWGMVYTTDGGAGFKGVARNEYTDYYKMDEEFAEVYGMLYEKPFYDERLKEHLDMNRYKLLDSETAENIEKPKSISEMEELAGKAQRCVLVDTEEDTGNIERVTFEYDLSDGRILVVYYLNKSEDNNMDLRLSHKYIREVYNQDEESAQTAPAQPASSPSAAAA